MKVVMVLYPGNGHKVEFGELKGQPVPGSANGEIGLREYLEGVFVDMPPRRAGSVEGRPRPVSSPCSARSLYGCRWYKIASMAVRVEGGGL